MTSKDEDSVIPLSRFRAELAGPSARQRIDDLLDAKDAADQVAALAVPDFYFLVKEVGLDEAGDLLALATAEQVRGCLDLECWNRDRVEPTAALPWLVALANLSPEKLAAGWAGLDPELAALLVRRTCDVYDLSMGEAPPEEEERPIFATPDTFFSLVFIGERDDDIRAVHQVVDYLYRGDADLIRHTLMSARSELDADLEEQSYRWRAGRMADLGYVEFYDALEVYRPLDPGAVKIGEGTAEGARSPEPAEGKIGALPVPVAERLAGQSFLGRALGLVTDAAEADRLRAALLYLVNRVLSAARVSPGNEEAVRVGTEHATATLALGLEQISAGSLGHALEALRTVGLSRLHRVGYTVTLRLARLAAQLAPRAASAAAPTSDVLEALLGRRPFFPRALDDGDGKRPFEAMADVRRVAEHLAELAARIALAEALGVDLIAIGEAPEPRPELDDHARTALARYLGGGSFDAAPLSADELDGFLGAAFDDGELTEAARTRAAQGLVTVLDQAGITAGREVYPALLSRWLDELDDELGGLEAGVPIDPRTIDRVITSLRKA